MIQGTLSFIAFLLFLVAQPGYCQSNPAIQDTNLNNLVHPQGYKTCKPGELGRVKEIGMGSQSMIIICGWGFDDSVFKEFAEQNKRFYKMYIVTPAGFGGSPAPPMPDSGGNYDKQSWTNGIVNGVLHLIEKKKLIKPVIVGHFVIGTQAALNLALYHSDKISKVIILGGEAYRYYSVRGDTVFAHESKFNAEQRKKMVDMYWAPHWFKTVTEKTWTEGNYKPGDYCKNETKGKKLQQLSNTVPLPVMIRYLLEFFTYDLSERYSEIKIPVLVMMPSFSETYFQTRGTFNGVSFSYEYLKYFYQQTWENSKGKNPLFEYVVVPDAHIFVWYDNPGFVYNKIKEFMKK